MDMSTFWATVPQAEKLTLAQVKAKYPGVIEDLLKSDYDPTQAEFSFGVIPNLQPGGATSDEDEADLAERDPDEEIMDADGPSLSGMTDLMAYFPEIDELHMWRPDLEGGRWLLWNY